MITRRKTIINPHSFSFKSDVFFFEKGYLDFEKLIRFYYSWVKLNKTIGWQKIFIYGPESYKSKPKIDW